MVEICDNAIDDDGDGLIDIQDADCICNGLVDSIFNINSLIPNPSFEKYSMCPTNVSQMDRCIDWIQASKATPDYYNLCGFKNSPQNLIYPPQPLPAGKGYVGIIDQKLINDLNDTFIYKEYIGACLNSPIKAGQEYVLNFWLGFADGPRYPSSQKFNIGIFATKNCFDLPFGNSLLNTNCPLQNPNWLELSNATISGKNEWKRVKIRFKSSFDVTAIAIGPSCAEADSFHYYWLDNFVLEESVKFEFLDINITGNPCLDTVQLNPNNLSSYPVKYQWYKNGIAILTETQANLRIPKGNKGLYVLRISYNNNCQFSKPFLYEEQQLLTTIKKEICNGDSVFVAGKKFNKTGRYFDTLLTKQGCDSILDIQLVVNSNFIESRKLNICMGDSIYFYGKILKKPGIYSYNFSSISSCDSIIQLEIEYNSRDTTKLLFNKCNGDSLRIGIKSYSQAGLYEEHYTNVNNCDSMVQFSIIDHPKNIIKIDTQICEGTFFKVGNTNYTTSGIYRDTFQNIFTCDSVVILDLKVNSHSSVIMDSSICDGNYVEVLNTKYYLSGQYHLKTANNSHCDSNIVLNLKTNNIYSGIIRDTICEGAFYQIGSQRFSKSGQYLVLLKSVHNCDSIINLDLNIRTTNTTKIDTSICFGQVLKLGNRTFTESGNYIYTEKATNFCDSMILIHLVIEPEITFVDSINQNKCIGDKNASIKLSIQGGKEPYLYYWNTQDTTKDISNLISNSYELQLIDAGGCITKHKVVIPEPTCLCFDLKTVDGSCYDSLKGRILIHQISGAHAKQYFLNEKEVGLTQNQISGLKNGDYKLQIIDSNGCKFVQNVKINFDDSYIQDYGVDSLFVNVGDPIQLSTNFNNNNKYAIHSWTGPGRIECDTCKKAHTVALAGVSKYNYEGQDEIGCFNKYLIVIVASQVFNVPNVFSPNGDNTNDYFNLISDNSIAQVDLLQIYDRWGNRVFESKGGIPNSLIGAWDGTAYGRKVNPGVFMYLIRFKDVTGKEFLITGEVSLLK